MSLPVWPADVKHYPMRPSYRLAEPHVAPVETEFDGGAFRRRPRATVRRRLFAIVWEWEGAEFDSFEHFYNVTLGEGSQRFTMPVFDVTDYAVRTCQFKGMYEATRPSRFWQVSAQLYVFEEA